MIPRFRENDYYGAVTAAVETLTGLASGEIKVVNKMKEAENEDGIGALFWIIIILLMIWFVARSNKKNKGGNSGTRTGRTTTPRYYGGGYSSSSGSSGSSSSGGSFGGFGGGSFGGGGASGSWSISLTFRTIFPCSSVLYARDTPSSQENLSSKIHRKFF